VVARAARINVPVTSMPSRTRRLMLGNKVDVLPHQMTYKVSYPVEARAQEGQLFSRFVGHFGVADVVGFHVCGPDEPHGSTERFFQHAAFWDVFDGVDSGPEMRSQQCIALSSEGRSLLDLEEEGGIPSPCELLDTILHAIIGEYRSHVSASTHTLSIMDLGHCNLFLGGVLHRDISSGNILRYMELVKRPALERCAWGLPCLGQHVLMNSTGSRAQRMWICVGGSSLTGIVRLNGKQFPTYPVTNDRCVPENRLPHSLQLMMCSFPGYATIRVYTTSVGLEYRAANHSHGCGRYRVVSLAPFVGPCPYTKEIWSRRHVYHQNGEGFIKQGPGYQYEQSDGRDTPLARCGVWKTHATLARDTHVSSE